MGAEISGDPQALAAALEKIHHYAQGIPLHGDRAASGDRADDDHEPAAAAAACRACSPRTRAPRSESAACWRWPALARRSDEPGPTRGRTASSLAAELTARQSGVRDTAWRRIIWSGPSTRLRAATADGLRRDRIPRSATSPTGRSADYGYARFVGLRLNRRPPPPGVAALQAVVISQLRAGRRNAAVIVDQAVRRTRTAGDPALRAAGVSSTRPCAAMSRAGGPRCGRRRRSAGGDGSSELVARAVADGLPRARGRSRRHGLRRGRCLLSRGRCLAVPRAAPPIPRAAPPVPRAVPPIPRAARPTPWAVPPTLGAWPTPIATGAPSSPRRSFRAR